MKLTKTGSVLGVLLLAVSVAFGGGEKCKMSTQECLDTMATKMKDSGWVGVELEGIEGAPGMTVLRVVPDSPAEAAGIEVGDVLLAINGIELIEENQEKLSENRAKSKPGATTTWTMTRGDARRELHITLAPMPADVLAAYIGQHMLEHASVELAKGE